MLLLFIFVLLVNWIYSNTNPNIDSYYSKHNIPIKRYNVNDTTPEKSFLQSQLNQSAFYLLRSFPTISTFSNRPYHVKPCEDPLLTLPFLQGTTLESMTHSECKYTDSEDLLQCKLGIYSKLNVEKYSSNAKVMVLWIQEYKQNMTFNRVLDLCFLNELKELKEFALCFYKPPIAQSFSQKDRYILDIPALATVLPKIKTLLISDVSIWQSIEIRQFEYLENLIISSRGAMTYQHSPYCADCENFHPQAFTSFHYLKHMSKLKYYLYQSLASVDNCQLDLLRLLYNRDFQRLKGFPQTIETLVIYEYNFKPTDPLCSVGNQCKSRFCPLLSRCEELPTYTCFCLTDLKKDTYEKCAEFETPKPIYSQRCKQQSTWFKEVKYFLWKPVICVVVYVGASLLVLIGTTIWVYFVSSNR